MQEIGGSISLDFTALLMFSPWTELDAIWIATWKLQVNLPKYRRNKVSRFGRNANKGFFTKMVHFFSYLRKWTKAEKITEMDNSWLKLSHGVLRS